jgi:hypothetical protein
MPLKIKILSINKENRKNFKGKNKKIIEGQSFLAYL